MTTSPTSRFSFTSDHPLPRHATAAGVNVGPTGVHSSRTLMLTDITAVLEACKASARRPNYIEAITDANCLGKLTASTRRLSAQRLSELYLLDPAVTLFRVFRRLWDRDPAGRKLIALLMALARDPLLRASAAPVLALPAGADLQRDTLRHALKQFTRERFNENILDKVLRNAASTWTQSGHLEGRTFKQRRLVEPTVPSATFALYLSQLSGFLGDELFSSGWFAALDCHPGRARELCTDAKRAGLIDLRIAGDVVDLKLDRLDPQSARGNLHGAH